jgi:hypothetical protein
LIIGENTALLLNVALQQQISHYFGSEQRTVRTPVAR